ncbi:hypothetical protein [Butyrivibrio sp. VCB2006]|uniref:hypothetical protein n=1 Tax=Butyrivibrio sp. VCB2006 TaxID=1280679 RepID=UPI000419D159|nr:hypothetical protein [Butyrivibrio sp. VCB2006]
MKFVYVLVSSESDYYYEQCIISICSLRRQVSDANVIVLADDVTYNGLVGKRAAIFQMAEVHSVDFDKAISPRVRSRLLKVSVRRRIEGRFMFVDTDTVFCENIAWPKQKIDIGMVLDRHLYFSDFWNRSFHDNNAKKLSFSSNYDNKHFNTGIILVSDSENAFSFYKLWEDLYKQSIAKGIYTDQASANEANSRMNGIIKELDGSWNVQPEYGLKFISEAKVIHYSGYRPSDGMKGIRYTIPFELCDEQYFLDTRKEGKPSLGVEKILDNPRAAFKDSYIIPNDCSAYYLVSSNAFRALRYIYAKCPGFFKVIERISSLFGKCVKGKE